MESFSDLGAILLQLPALGVAEGDAQEGFLEFFKSADLHDFLLFAAACEDQKTEEQQPTLLHGSPFLFGLRGGVNTYQL